MYSIKEYVMATSLEEAYNLNQKKTNRIIGGNMWLRLGNANIVNAIDLSKLGLNKIEENDEEFQLGCMVSLRQLELDEKLNEYTNNALHDCVKDIVGTQFRNSATVGGSIWGRFGFSDVLTCLLAMDTEVELYKAGRAALSDFVNMKPDNDILVKVIIKKNNSKANYQALRNAATDFPVIACCAVKKSDGWSFSIGAKPTKAVRYTASLEDIQNNMDGTLDDILEKITFGTNTRASKEYRKAMAKVLLKRAIKNVESDGQEV